MPSRPRVEEALGVLRSELDAGRSPVTELTTQDAWLARVLDAGLWDAA